MDVPAPTGTSTTVNIHRNISKRMWMCYFAAFENTYGILKWRKPPKLSKLKHKLKFCIFDEYSTIGIRMLCKIHKQFCEAKGVKKEPFGVLCVYFFVVLRQLLPVSDPPLYSNMPDEGCIC